MISDSSSKSFDILPFSGSVGLSVCVYGPLLRLINLSHIHSIVLLLSPSLSLTFHPSQSLSLILDSRWGNKALLTSLTFSYHYVLLLCFFSVLLAPSFSSHLPLPSCNLQ